MLRHYQRLFCSPCWFCRRGELWMLPSQLSHLSVLSFSFNSSQFLVASSETDRFPRISPPYILFQLACCGIITLYLVLLQVANCENNTGKARLLLYILAEMYECSYQLCMPFDCLLYPLGFNADVSLRHCCGAVLQEPLDQGDIIAVLLVNLRCVPLAEAVGADALIA